MLSQLFLDDIEGPTVSFPFSEDIVFEFGSYARRGEGAQPTDMVTGFFDNVLISGAAEECVGLSPPFTEVLPEDEPPVLTLQIPRDAPRYHERQQSQRPGECRLFQQQSH